MAEDFKVRRDSSTNNVPTVGYNEGIDAQDVVLFGACKVTETVTADGTGKITLTHHPVSLTGATFTDASGVRRGRNFNEDIVVTSVGGATKYYAGSVSPVDKTLKVYTDVNRTAVISGGSVSVTYYKRVPLKVNANGELVIEGQSTGTQDVNVASVGTTIPVAIKSSDISLSERTKSSIILKKEAALAAGASANPLDVTVGDATKDMYVTNVIAYYDGTGAETDPYLAFWFDVADSAGTSKFGTMDMPLPPKTKAPTQLDFGPGILIPAGSKLRFRVSANFVTNKIHAMALGYQYLD